MKPKSFFKIILFLPALLLLSSCRKDINTEEIIKIVDKHSAEEHNLYALDNEMRKIGFEAVEEIDDRAVYLPNTWKPLSLKEMTPGDASAGVALWRASPEKAEVVYIFRNSPAEYAGINPGDTIFSVNDIPMREISDGQLLEYLKGPPGISFSVKGETKEKKDLNVSLKRNFGGTPIVWGFRIPGTDVGYLRILSFSKNSYKWFRSSMNDILDAKAKKIVIDIRGNKGGSLAELSRYLNDFAPKRNSVLFYSYSRHKGYSFAFTSRRRGDYSDIKVAVLTDYATMSRAEIFAETLRYWKNALIVGGRTAGNISATRGFRMPNKDIMRITVSKLYPPSKLDLEKTGVIPDEWLKYSPSYKEDFPPLLVNSDDFIQKGLSVAEKES